MPSKLKLPGLKLLICRTKGVEVMSIPPWAADTFSKIGGCLSFKGTSQMTFLSFLCQVEQGLRVITIPRQVEFVKNEQRLLLLKEQI